MNVVTTVSLDPETYRALIELAHTRKVSRSALMRTWILREVEKERRQPAGKTDQAAPAAEVAA